VLAIVASIVNHMRKSYRPGTAVLIPGRDGAWHGVPAEPDTRSLPGLVIYRFAGSIYYANASLFLEQTSAFATAADPPRWICLAAGVIPDIDYSGAETIRQLHRELDEIGIKLVVAEPLGAVHRLLEHYGLSALLGEDAIYPTIDDAVRAFAGDPTVPPTVPRTRPT